ncbi:MAG: ThuA domain-containing protein [Acidobacteria bacterium]|nr:ThuA domain-containing protein [Acidobacteriota bacterium]
MAFISTPPSLRFLAIFVLALGVQPLYPASPRLKVLIIDGQNNHAWKETTPVLQEILEMSGRFEVDVATTPPQGGDMSTFKPDFSKYAVVVSNYNGDPWSKETSEAFEKFVHEGGGFVSYHAADNAFPEWHQYNQMIGVGGWGNRKAPDSGSMIRLRDDVVRVEPTPGRCGNHGARLPFVVTMRERRHPIVKGLPRMWKHAPDELYDSLCGPAADFDLLATAHSTSQNRGTNEDEPVLLALRYARGRVFHTTLGHDVAAMHCVGFIATLMRGTEWAATGRVTIPVPADFPSADRLSIRK